MSANEGAPRVAGVVPSIGASPIAAEALAALRRELAAAGGRLVWVHQGDRAAPEVGAGSERLFRLPSPVGFAAAVNAGLAAARADGPVDYVAVVNDDAVVAAGWLAALVDELARRPAAGAVQGANVVDSDPGHVDGCGLGWNRDWQAVQVAQGGTSAALAADPFEVFGVSATAALYRVAAVDAVAGERSPLFDERLESYYEDVELAVRLRAEGFDAWCVPAARARHAGQATFGASPERWRLLYRNRRRVTDALLATATADERRRVAARDRRDFSRALVAFDFARARAIAAGLREARDGAPASVSGSARALADARRLTVGSPA